MSGHVIIIGGGISGAAAAYELARNGVNVTLLERGELASMASGWTLAGVRQSGRHPSELPLAAAAVARWPSLDDELDADTEYRQHGNLRLALSESDVPTIRGVVAASAAAGIPIEYLDIYRRHSRHCPGVDRPNSWRVLLPLRRSCQSVQDRPGVCRGSRATRGRYPNWG